MKKRMTGGEGEEGIRNKDARALFKFNTAAFPDSPQSSYNLGFLYERIRNLEAALKYYETAYEKALKANPLTAGHSSASLFPRSEKCYLRLLIDLKT